MTNRARASRASRRQPERPRLLIADASARMREYLSLLLSDRYQIEIAVDGCETLEVARHWCPDLVLLDALMNGPDGLAVLRGFREDARLQTVPVILLSDRSGDEAEMEGIEAGADDYIVKPFSARELLARVEAQVKMSRLRLQATEALRRSEERYRHLVEQSVDGIFVADEQGRYVDMNPAGCEMLGMTRDDVLASSYTDVLAPEEHHRIAAEVARFEDGSVVRSEWRMRRKDGSIFVGEIVGRKLPDGSLQGILRDITERKEVEERLRQSEASQRLAMEAANAGSWQITPATGEFAASEQALALHGLMPGTPLTHDVALTMVHPDDRPRVEAALLHTLRTGERLKLEVRIPQADGSVRWVASFAELQIGSAHPQLVGLVQDITDRKRHEERLNLLMREVNHRSKNMLALVQAIARQTAGGGEEGFVQRFEERIDALAANQDLLVKSAWEGVDLDALVRSQLAHFEDLLDSRIAVSGPPLTVSAEASQTLGMALHELATNAGKYGALSEGNGSVSICWAIEQHPPDGAWFAIRWREMNGPRVASPLRKGFGFTVISEMTRMTLDADVSLDFAPTGLEWHLRCPIGNVVEGIGGGGARTTSASANQPPEEQGRGATSAPCVLVVEDEVLIALEVAEILAEAGFKVLGPAGSVAQAVSLLERYGCDAAVLDVNLGHETSEPIAAWLASRGIPFIVVSGYAQSQQPAALKDVPLLNKPVRAERLLAELRRSLAAD